MRKHRKQVDRTCPSPAQLVAYASRVPGAEAPHSRLATHLARCPRCCLRVAVIQAALERDLVAEVAAAYCGVISGAQLRAFPPALEQPESS